MATFRSHLDATFLSLPVVFPSDTTTLRSHSEYALLLRVPDDVSGHAPTLGRLFRPFHRLDVTRTDWPDERFSPEYMVSYLTQLPLHAV